MHCTKCVRFGAITIALLDILVYVWALVQIWRNWGCHCLIFTGSSTKGQVIATIIYAGVLFPSILLAWGLAKRKNHHFLPWLTIRGIHLTVLGMAFLLLLINFTSKQVNLDLGPEWNSMFEKIFLYAIYPISTFHVIALINPNQLYPGSIAVLIACGLIFAIYVAVFFLVKSEWNNVRKHKRLQRLQEFRNAIKLETMANDPEVATQQTSLIDSLATRPLTCQPIAQPPPAGYAPIIANYAPTAREPRTPPPSYPSLTGWM